MIWKSPCGEQPGETSSPTGDGEESQGGFGKQAVDLDQCMEVERGKEDPLSELILPDEIGHRVDQIISRRCVICELDIDNCMLSDRVKYLFKAWNGFAAKGAIEMAARVHLFQISHGMFADLPFGLRRAIYRLVVDDDRMTVGGKLCVQLDGISALLQCQLECCQRILRRAGRMLRDER